MWCTSIWIPDTPISKKGLWWIPTPILGARVKNICSFIKLSWLILLGDSNCGAKGGNVGIFDCFVDAVELILLTLFDKYKHDL